MNFIVLDFMKHKLICMLFLYGVIIRCIDLEILSDFYHLHMCLIACYLPHYSDRRLQQNELIIIRHGILGSVLTC